MNITYLLIFIGIAFFIAIVVFPLLVFRSNQKERDKDKLSSDEIRHAVRKGESTYDRYRSSTLDRIDGRPDRPHHW